jgi:hypothetical protein
MIFMRSNIRNLSLLNNFLVDLSENELPDEFISESDDNIAILYIVNFRGAILYYLSEYTSQKSVVSENQFENFEKNSDLLACPICMEDSEENIILPCDHAFCSECIKKWLLKNANTCPNCRKSVA